MSHASEQESSARDSQPICSCSLLLLLLHRLHLLIDLLSNQFTGFDSAVPEPACASVAFVKLSRSLALSLSESLCRAREYILRPATNLLSRRHPRAVSLSARSICRRATKADVFSPRTTGRTGSLQQVAVIVGWLIGMRFSIGNKLLIPGELESNKSSLSERIV